MIKVILWDIDGTLLDFEAAEKAAIGQCFASHNMGECTDEMLKRYSAINRKYWEALEKGTMSKPEILVGRFREFFETEGLPVEHAESFNAEYQVRLGDTVCFHGWMEYDELIELYQSVDFLYMSRPDNLVTRANFPSKLPELMAYAVAPIGNRVGDYYEYLTDGVDSVLFDKNTPEDCVTAIRRVIAMSKEERQSMCQNARNTVCEKFDYKKWANKLDGFMENLK